MINIIVAYNWDQIIGTGLQLPWHIPADLKRFKALTQDKICVMGSVTYDSLAPYFPGKEVLPGRKKLILSNSVKSVPYGTVCSIDHVKHLDKIGEDVWIIGGGKVYEIFVPLADKIFATEVDLMVPRNKDNVFFPNKRTWENDFDIKYKEQQFAGEVSYNFVNYERKK